ncbi:MAG TPA: hypothetical protein VHJ82_09765, partial [Actinomycetota bacterium]|nr:hypothetical protein [Actinomycetota bacterium]
PLRFVFTTILEWLPYYCGLAQGTGQNTRSIGTHNEEFLQPAPTTTGPARAHQGHQANAFPRGLAPSSGSTVDPALSRVLVCGPCLVAVPVRRPGAELAARAVVSDLLGRRGVRQVEHLAVERSITITASRVSA